MIDRVRIQTDMQRSRSGADEKSLPDNTCRVPTAFCTLRGTFSPFHNWSGPIWSDWQCHWSLSPLLFWTKIFNYTLANTVWDCNIAVVKQHMKNSMYKQVGFLCIFEIMVSKEQRALLCSFPLFLSFSLLCFFFFFFLRWHGSLWCSWIKSSVQDSQCETALMGNWRLDITLRVMSSLFLATLLIFTMLAAVLSQRVVLQRHKKKQGKHYDHIHQTRLSHSSPFIKRRFFILPHKEHNRHLHILWLASLLMILAFEHHFY